MAKIEFVLIKCQRQWHQGHRTCRCVVFFQSRQVLLIIQGRHSEWREPRRIDFIVVAGFNDDRMGESIAEGMRSQSFSGYNTSGFSLIGCGRCSPEGGFDHLNVTAYWVYPQEHEYDIAEYAYAAYVSKNSNDGTGTSSDRRAEKKGGRFVRCTKLE